MGGWFLEVHSVMTNFCNKATNSIAKVMNSIASRTNSITKTCKIVTLPYFLKQMEERQAQMSLISLIDFVLASMHSLKANGNQKHNYYYGTRVPINTLTNSDHTT